MIPVYGLWLHSSYGLHGPCGRYQRKAIKLNHSPLMCALIIKSKEEGSWWPSQMETFSALLAICAGNSPVTGEFPAQRPVTQSFDVFFDLHLKRLSKHLWDWWFETQSHPLWCHCNVAEAQWSIYPSKDLFVIDVQIHGNILTLDTTYNSGSPHKVPIFWSFYLFFDISLNTLLNKQLSYRWFEMPWCSYDILVWT